MLKKVSKDIYVENIFVADKDGQVITETEVVNYNAGDIIIAVAKWVNGKNRQQKVIVFTDKAASDDLARWYNEETNVNYETS